MFLNPADRSSLTIETAAAPAPEVFPEENEPPVAEAPPEETEPPAPEVAEPDAPGVADIGKEADE